MDRSICVIHRQSSRPARWGASVEHPPARHGHQKEDGQRSGERQGVGRGWVQTSLTGDDTCYDGMGSWLLKRISQIEFFGLKNVGHQREA